MLLATAVSTLFQDGLPAKAGSPEAQDPWSSPSVPLPAAYTVLTAALAVGPAGRHAEPHQRGLAQPLPGRCVSVTLMGEWGRGRQKGSLSQSSAAQVAPSLPPIIYFHMFLPFDRSYSFN